MRARLAVAVTAWRESRRAGFAWIREALAAPSAHRAVSDLLVYDDGSDDADGLEAALRDVPRVRLVRGERNLGVFGAKLESVIEARGDWVLMCDSDNVFDATALDHVAQQGVLDGDDATLYCPSFGRPALDYRNMIGRWWLRDAPRLLGMPRAGCLMNTGNQVVPRLAFLDVLGDYRGDVFVSAQQDYFPGRLADPLTRRRVYDSADSFFINKTWLLRGGSLVVAPWLEYVHGSLTPEHQALVRSSWEQAPPEREEIPPRYERELLEAARAAA